MKWWFQLKPLRPCAIIEGRKGRNWNRDHGGALLIDLFFTACSECFLIQPRPNCPGETPHTVSWTLLCQPILKKLPHRSACCRDFLYWGSLFSGSSSLGWVDKNQWGQEWAVNNLYAPIFLFWWTQLRTWQMPPSLPPVPRQKLNIAKNQKLATTDRKVYIL